MDLMDNTTNEQVQRGGVQAQIKAPGLILHYPGITSEI